MILATEYAGRSAILNGLTEGRVAFATNRLRETTFLQGTLAKPLLFRESLAALYQVVVSDFKYRPRDRLAFFSWLEEQDRKFLASLNVRGDIARQRLAVIDKRLTELNQERNDRQRAFHKARMNYFNYLYESEFEQQLLLDPVITVHPDEVAFEAFSRDESTYARLAAKFELFGKIDRFECGTTNIDFSHTLHNELERMRSYRRTRFDIAPSGLSVELQDRTAHKEKKIDLPDSWVMGFLQVHSTMTLGLTHFRIEPVDLFNICRFLRRHKTKTSPRSLKFELVPGKRVKAILEPWNHVVEMSPLAKYTGDKPQTIRTWGRQRLQVMSRLLPLAKHVDVYLAGHGLPSIYVMDLGDVVFTLALSGWTDNDWTGGAKFDLLTRRLNVTGVELKTVYDALKQTRYAGAGTIAQRTGLGLEKARSALSHLCQEGRAMYDLAGGVFRQRDLFLDPFTMQQAQTAIKASRVPSPQEKQAQAIFNQKKVRIIARRPVPGGGYKLSGSARGNESAPVRPQLHVDDRGQIVEASCTCSHYKRHQMTQGPCEHILALRLAHMDRLENEEESGG